MTDLKFFGGGPKLPGLPTARELHLPYAGMFDTQTAKASEPAEPYRSPGSGMTRDLGGPETDLYKRYVRPEKTGGLTAADYEDIGTPFKKVVDTVSKDLISRGRSHGVPAPMIGGLSRDKDPTSETFERAIDSMAEAIVNPKQYFNNIGVDESAVDEALADMLEDAKTPKKMREDEKYDLLLNLGLQMMMRGGQPGAKNAGLLGVMGASALSAREMFKKEKERENLRVQRVQELSLARLTAKEQKEFKKELAAAGASADANLENIKGMRDLYKHFSDLDAKVGEWEARFAADKYKTDVGFAADKYETDVGYKREELRAAAKVQAAKKSGKGGKSDLDKDSEYLQGLTDKSSDVFDEDEFKKFDTPEEKENAIRQDVYRQWSEDVKAGGYRTRAQALAYKLRKASNLKDFQARYHRLMSDPKIVDEFHNDFKPSDVDYFREYYKALEKKHLYDSLGVKE